MRCLPPLTTALFSPALSLPDIQSMEVRCAADHLSCINITAHDGCKSGRGMTFNTTLTWGEEELKGDPTEQETVDSGPPWGAAVELEFGAKATKEFAAEYDIYYQLLRSGLFKLNLFECRQTPENNVQLPPNFVYPDAIAWPFGIFQEYSPGSESGCALLFPKCGRSLWTYYSMNGRGSLPAGARRALIETLNKIHRAGYIHRSINSRTIYVNVSTGVAVFTSFYRACKCDDEEKKQQEMYELLELV